jgi:hypothetical protein
MLRTTDQCLDVKRAETEQLSMSPTVFKEDGYRFFFFSREELRMHVHVHCDSGEAKFWMEPKIELAKNYGLHNNELRTVKTLIEEHADEIRDAWRRHFGS